MHPMRDKNSRHEQGDERGAKTARGLDYDTNAMKTKYMDNIRSNKDTRTSTGILV